MACPLCTGPVAAGEPATSCPECATVYHAECWEDNGGCGVYGCAGVPQTVQRDTLEVPAAWWGQEDKPCPQCGTRILAMARRCRQCGATFASERPRGVQEFQHEQDLERKSGALRTTAVVLLVLSLVPPLAPLAAAAGVAWYLKDRDEIRALPPLHRGLFRLALVLSATMSVVFGLALASHAIFG